MKKLPLIIFAITFSVITACSSKETRDSKSISSENLTVSCTSAQIKSMGLMVSKATWKERSGTLNANGIIDVPPGNKSYISLPYGGFIKKMNVIEGKQVDKGEILFEVQHPDILLLQQEYLELIGRMDYLEASLNRQLTMESGKATSQKNVQEAQAEYNVAQAKIKGISARLKMAEVDMNALKQGRISETQQIRAPFFGIVTKITTGVGSFVAPQDKLMEIIDLKHTHAELTVFEKDIPLLRLGQQVDIHFIQESQAAKAQIYLIGGEIDVDRSIKVHCHFNETGFSPIPGSYFKAKIHTDSKRTLCLPNAAFITVGTETYVFKEISKHQFTAVKVRILGEEEGETSFELLDANSHNSTFVIQGAFELLSLWKNKGES